MGRIPNFRRLRARSAEEQMLATMLIAGLVFAVVSLVAFLRPGSGSTAIARAPRLSAPANTRSSDDGDSGRRARVSRSSTSEPASTDSALQPAAFTSSDASITQRLQGLFAAVVSPLGFSTNLPPLDPSPVAIQPVSVGGTTPDTFPRSFPPLPGQLPPPVNLPPVTDTLPPTTDTLPPPTTITAPPTTTTLAPTTTTQPVTTTQPTTTTTQPTTTIPPTTDTTQPTTTIPPTTDTTQPTTTIPPTTDTTSPPTTDTTVAPTTLPPVTDTTLPPLPLP